MDARWADQGSEESENLELVAPVYLPGGLAEEEVQRRALCRSVAGQGLETAR